MWGVASLFGKEFDVIHFAGHVENGLVLCVDAMNSKEVPIREEAQPLPGTC